MIKCVKARMASFAIAIPHTKTTQDETGRTVVLYTVTVSNGDSKGVRTTVNRRYREFRILRRIVDKFYNIDGGESSSIMLPKLPAKLYIGAETPAFVEQRRVALEAYLRQLARMPRCIMECNGFRAFLGLQDGLRASYGQVVAARPEGSLFDVPSGVPVSQPDPTPGLYQAATSALRLLRDLAQQAGKGPHGQDDGSTTSVIEGLQAALAFAGDGMRGLQVGVQQASEGHRPGLDRSAHGGATGLYQGAAGRTSAPIPGPGPTGKVYDGWMTALQAAEVLPPSQVSNGTDGLKHSADTLSQQGRSTRASTEQPSARRRSSYSSYEEDCAGEEGEPLPSAVSYDGGTSVHGSVVERTHALLSSASSAAARSEGMAGEAVHSDPAALLRMVQDLPLLVRASSGHSTASTCDTVMVRLLPTQQQLDARTAVENYMMNILRAALGTQCFPVGQEACRLYPAGVQHAPITLMIALSGLQARGWYLRLAEVLFGLEGGSDAAGDAGGPAVCDLLSVSVLEDGMMAGRPWAAPQTADGDGRVLFRGSADGATLSAQVQSFSSSVGSSSRPQTPAVSTGRQQAHSRSVSEGGAKAPQSFPTSTPTPTTPMATGTAGKQFSTKTAASRTQSMRTASGKPLCDISRVTFVGGPAHSRAVQLQVNGFTVHLVTNQLHELATVALIEVVDTTIGRHHMFKRSLLLVQSWCKGPGRVLAGLSWRAWATALMWLFVRRGQAVSSPWAALCYLVHDLSEFPWDQQLALSLYGNVSVADVLSTPGGTHTGTGTSYTGQRQDRIASTGLQAEPSAHADSFSAAVPQGGHSRKTSSRGSASFADRLGTASFSGPGQASAPVEQQASGAPTAGAGAGAVPEQPVQALSSSALWPYMSAGGPPQSAFTNEAISTVVPLPSILHLRACIGGLTQAGGAETDVAPVQSSQGHARHWSLSQSSHGHREEPYRGTTAASAERMGSLGSLSGPDAGGASPALQYSVGAIDGREGSMRLDSLADLLRDMVGGDVPVPGHGNLHGGTSAYAESMVTILDPLHPTFNCTPDISAAQFQQALRASASSLLACMRVHEQGGWGATSEEAMAQLLGQRQGLVSANDVSQEAWHVLSGNAASARSAVDFCSFLLGGGLSAAPLLSLAADVLLQRGPLPVGEIGKCLQEVAAYPGLSSAFKEKYGGLKRFLEGHAEFLVSSDHPFNPHVYLVSTLSPAQEAMIRAGKPPSVVLSPAGTTLEASHPPPSMKQGGGVGDKETGAGGSHRASKGSNGQGTPGKGGHTPSDVSSTPSASPVPSYPLHGNSHGSAGRASTPVGTGAGAGQHGQHGQGSTSGSKHTVSRSLPAQALQSAVSQPSMPSAPVAPHQLHHLFHALQGAAQRDQAHHAGAHHGGGQGMHYSAWGSMEPPPSSSLPWSQQAAAAGGTYGPVAGGGRGGQVVPAGLPAGDPGRWLAGEQYSDGFTGQTEQRHTRGSWDGIQSQPRQVDDGQRVAASWSGHPSTGQRPAPSQPPTIAFAQGSASDASLHAAFSHPQGGLGMSNILGHAGRTL